MSWEAGSRPQMSVDRGADCSDEESWDEGCRSPDGYAGISDNSAVSDVCGAESRVCDCADVVSPGTYRTAPGSRTLHHPSFEAYYAAVAIARNTVTPWVRQKKKEGFIINNGDYFYTDPLHKAGHRVYNSLSPATLEVFRCFRLNTPPLAMSPEVFVSPQFSYKVSSPSAFDSPHASSVPGVRAAPQAGLPSVMEDNLYDTSGKDLNIGPSHSDGHNAQRAEPEGAIHHPVTSAEADAVLALLLLSGSAAAPRPGPVYKLDLV